MVRVLRSLTLGRLGGSTDFSVLSGLTGLVGAWTAMFLDLYVRGFFFLGRFAGGRWKLLRV